jgi:hypothetical protein
MLRLNSLLALGLALPAPLFGQITPGQAAGAQTADIGRILERLDRVEQANARLERENRELANQLAELKRELAASPPGAAASTAVTTGLAAPAGTAAAAADSSAAPQATLEERQTIVERRVDEQAQIKVEASQRYPIRITGMALFNAYYNSRYGGGQQYPGAASLNASPPAVGGTLRQSIIGLEFHGPKTFFGADVNGAVAMDFFTGGVSFNSTFRLRTGSINLDWKTTKFMVGIEKPIFNPREPASLAQVGVSPLTGAGNLWLWIPQARIEQDFAFTGHTGLRARVGIVQTHETPPYDAASGTPAPSSRPGAEGRVEFYHQIDDDRRLEVAGGFHTSQTHAGGFSIPSRVYAGDWFYNPFRKLEWTGAFFTGENVTNLGAGPINEGYAVYRSSAIPITTRGGWTQFTIHAVRRVDLHLFSGTQYYESRVLDINDASRTVAFGANIFFRIAPNVLIGPEAAQFRTLYIGRGTRLTNHYDFALAYLF